MAVHAGHPLLIIKGLDERLMTPPTLPEAHKKAEKTNNGIIDSCTNYLQQLKHIHSEHIIMHVGAYRKHHALSRKILNRDHLSID